MFRIYRHEWKDVKTGEKKQSSNWYCQLSFKGTRKPGKSTNTTNKAEATKIGMQWMRDLEQEVDNAGKPTLTVAQALDRWHETRGSNKKLGAWVRKLQGSSIDRRTQQKIDVHGLDPAKSFDTVTTGDVQRLITARLAAGTAPATVLQELSVLSNAIGHWRRNEYPVPTIDFSELKRGNSLTPDNGRLRFLTKEEAQRLMTELHPDTPVMLSFGMTERAKPDTDSVLYQQRQDIYDLAVTLLLTGARYSEISKLQWRQVDLNSRSIHLYRPKVKNQSMLKMNDTLLSIMQRRSDSKSGDFVFTSKDGSSRNYSPIAFKRACERAGLHDVTIHTLRHSCASWMAIAGMPLQQIQQQLGHKTIAMTQRYAHLLPSQGADRAAQVVDLT